MNDFNLTIYKKLLVSLKNNGYSFITFEQYCQGIRPSGNWIILRHDVDDKKLNSQKFSEIQHDLNIKATYYFRMVPQSFDPVVIKKIYDLGHEIGYHYEDMDFASGKTTVAIQYFEKHLAKLREVVPINTLCMHGSPRSLYDNKDIWKAYDYKKYDLIGEPYFDMDFNQIFYITDTGRMWDGFKVSVRDKVATTVNWPEYHTTQQIIEAIENKTFPSMVMMNFHPQRWTDNKYLWLSELVKQSIKNSIKKYFFVKR